MTNKEIISNSCGQQVLYIYWQAWGLEQAQLRKHMFVIKSSRALKIILYGIFVDTYSFQVNLSRFNYGQSLQLWRSFFSKRSWETHESASSRIKLYCDTLIRDCLWKRLPIYEPMNAMKCTSVFLQCVRRIFSSNHQQHKHRHKYFGIDSLRRVDAIVCLF